MYQIKNINERFLAIAVLALLQPQLGQAATLEVALKLKPIQPGVQVDSPSQDELPKCTIKTEKVNGTTAWVVRNPAGDVLRQFADSNADNVVDTWSYYRDGLEIYRDIDTDFNGKADQYRWFHWAGTRWGINADEDANNTIDNWKLISPEETAEQVVNAIRTGNQNLFESLVLTKKEIENLGLTKQQADQLISRSDSAVSTFKNIVDSGNLGKDSEFSDFGGLKPGMVPAGTHGSRKDLMVYENAWAMVKSADQHQQLQLGTMVSIKGAWKLIDGPVLGSQSGLSGFFFVPDNGGIGEGVAASIGNQPTEKVQELLSQLEKLDQKITTASDKEKPELNGTRAKLLLSIANMMTSTAEREQWLKQLADMVSAAAQGGTFPKGLAFLKSMEKKLEDSGDSKNIRSYFEFHSMLAEYYGVTMADPEVDYAKAQAKWQEDLEEYIERNPESEHGAEALRMLAINSEMAGQTEDSIKWYRRILDDYPESPAKAIAKGAVTRLTSEGKKIQLAGEAVQGGKVDLGSYRGKVVVIQYWTTTSPVSKSDHAVLSDLYKKYGGNRGLEIIGVNLDYTRSELLEYLKTNRLPWKQLHEPGGFDSRLATDLGVVTVPLMLLVGPDGNVISNNIQASEIEEEVKKLRVASRK